MDTALELRLCSEKGEIPADAEIERMHRESALLGRLTGDFVPHPLFATFRLLGLCEVPFAQRLPYTQKLIDYCNDNMATEAGFAPLGGAPDLVPCYNAMLLEAYCRLGLADSPQAQAALAWILAYQLFERDGDSDWKSPGIRKHGGCLGSVPCYIGVGKTVRALLAYAQNTSSLPGAVAEKTEQCLAYMLRHGLYHRLSSSAPVAPYITDIMFPQSYVLSLTDLVYIAGAGGLFAQPGAEAFRTLVAKKQLAPGQWKIDYIYSYKGYIAFEGRRKPSQWASALFPLWMDHV